MGWDLSAMLYLHPLHFIFIFWTRNTIWLYNFICFQIPSMFPSYFTVGLLIYHNETIPCSCRFFSSICYYHWTCLLSKKKKRGKRSLDMLSPTPRPLHLTPPEFFFSFSDTCVIIQYAPWLEAWVRAWNHKQVPARIRDHWWFAILWNTVQVLFYPLS